MFGSFYGNSTVFDIVVSTDFNLERTYSLLHLHCDAVLAEDN